MTGASVVANQWGWRHASRRHFALDNLSLEISPGEKVLLLGPSGAGKSTLLHALAGVLEPDQGESHGELLLDGQPAQLGQTQVGLVLQDPASQVIVGKVGDDVAFGPESQCVPRPEIWQRVQASLAAVGLEVGFNRPTNALSGGQKQRMALAGSLAMGPQLLLLDEPTANLDPEGILEVRDAILAVQAATGATLVVVEHRVPIWAKQVDRIIVLERGGGVRASGRPDEILADLGQELSEQGVWIEDFQRPTPLPKWSAKKPADAGTPILSARDLTIGYQADHPVQEKLNCDILAGISTCITGVNGAGKSTLALTMAGLLPALSGQVLAAPTLRRPHPNDPRPRKALWGKRRKFNKVLADTGLLPPDPHDWESKHLLPRIGTVFQAPEHQFLTSTVRQELLVGPLALGVNQAEAEAKADEVLARLGLLKLAKANPFTLSGGEKRRLSVATVLVSSPQVIFLDEPTFGQDLKTWRELVALLKDLVNQGVTLVSVTHDEAYLDALGQQILHVDESGVKVIG
ncbi:hypothetical protein BK816_06725 [Boudabousia tangfeifanii]|uniref:ABC transporter domain-containing protein n=1 Tax=Boudabousia tangfeifanii TaxID=1912795 RepID=A0A1D9MLI4_9ACTO|nr:ABC transporter ATP-binding protein [Boudabousia tangfeifanii]AOZ73020.1 hypothetical protein BK816_06725 [Boudabousia tangfeifanii]